MKRWRGTRLGRRGLTTNPIPSRDAFVFCWYYFIFWFILIFPVVCANSNCNSAKKILLWNAEVFFHLLFHLASRIQKDKLEGPSGYLWLTPKAKTPASSSWPRSLLPRARSARMPASWSTPHSPTRDDFRITHRYRLLCGINIWTECSMSDNDTSRNRGGFKWHDKTNSNPINFCSVRRGVTDVEILTFNFPPRFLFFIYKKYSWCGVKILEM